jgi:site-specific DNA-cytosine methylase
VSERIYTVAFPFCGAGFGALGFIRAATHLLETELRFRSVGGIDNDPIACREFERLTSSPALCADVSTLTPEELRAAWGDEAPDVLFGSPPCRGFSGLLGEEKSRRPEYQKMNLLVTQWLELVFATWAHAPPRLILLENVPRLPKRAPETIEAVRRALRSAGYAVHEGFHDCGEIGGLAQHRRRYLMVARHERTVGSLLYKPPKQRVRGCGEVLAQLPVPGTEEARAAGPLHELPALSWINWVRLALIPAGGDWRDLRGVLERVESWETAAHTVTGSTRVGSGAPSVADPRPCFRSVLGVTSWLAPSNVITGNGRPQSGTFSVADPRVDQAFDHGYGVQT